DGGVDLADVAAEIDGNRHRYAVPAVDLRLRQIGRGRGVDGDRHGNQSSFAMARTAAARRRTPSASRSGGLRVKFRRSARRLQPVGSNTLLGVTQTPASRPAWESRSVSRFGSRATAHTNMPPTGTPPANPP